MISKPFGIALLSLGLLSLAAGMILLKLDNARLRKRTAEAQHDYAEAVRVRAENRRTRELLEKANVSQQDAAFAIHTEVVQLREELERLEKRAVDMHATTRMKAARDADLLPEIQRVAEELLRGPSERVDALVQRWVGAASRYGQV